MPEIYCLSASTPHAYTWPHVEARRGRKDWVRLKRKKTSTGEGMVEEEEEQERERESKRKVGGRVQVAKLKHPFPLSPFVRADDGARRVRARQKISKIRRPMRGTVRRAIRCRIYKERRRDLCRTVGYLSVSMVHAISLHGYRYVLTSEAESPPSIPPPFSFSLPLSPRIYPALLLHLSLTLFLSFFIF